MPTKGMANIHIELAIHNRIRNEAARRKIKIQAMVSQLLHKVLPEFEAEQVHQKEFDEWKERVEKNQFRQGQRNLSRGLTQDGRPGYGD